jgi:4-hydroxythreonine-4-phosphate dehydrogenase
MRTSSIDERVTGALGVDDPSCEPSPPLAVTMGDPSGIGPDITLASWHLRTRLGLPRFVVYGSPAVLEARSKALGLATPIAPVTDPGAGGAAFGDALPVCTIAGADANAGVVAAIEQATAAVVAGEALALITNPITKRALNLPELAYPGHTEFLAQLAARYARVPKPRPVMMLAADELKVVPVTVHIPLSAVIKSLTRSLLSDTIATTAAALRADFGIANPRIAVTGLNPHAGEGGLIGEEEVRVIAPVIAELAATGLAVTGPHSADTLFHAEARQTYDVAIAMYHDQALIPIKTLAFDRGVNITLGLPFVRTSPDHGTAAQLAGTGKARPGSFIAALRLAHELGRRRLAQRSTRRP